MLDILKLLKLDNLFENLTAYIETKIEYYKIQFKEEVARALSILIFIYLLSLIAVIFLIFISFFIVVMLNHLFSSQYLGFLIVAGFYLLAGILMYVNREKLIYSKVFEEFFNRNKNNEES